MDKRSEKLYNCMRNYIKCLDDRNMKTDNYVQVVREASLAEAYKINNAVLRASIYLLMREKRPQLEQDVVSLLSSDRFSEVDVILNYINPKHKPITKYCFANIEKFNNGFSATEYPNIFKAKNETRIVAVKIPHGLVDERGEMITINDEELLVKPGDYFKFFYAQDLDIKSHLESVLTEDSEESCWEIQSADKFRIYYKDCDANGTFKDATYRDIYNQDDEYMGNPFDM